MKKRRHFFATKRKPASCSEAFQQAKYGEASSDAVGLYSLIAQLAAPGDDANRERLEKILVGRLVRLLRTQRGEPLRELAKIIETPTARPAMLEALAWRTEGEAYAACPDFRPHKKAAEICRAIMRKTGCDERTARRCMAEAGLAKFYGWKKGRPRQS